MSTTQDQRTLEVRAPGDGTVVGAITVTPPEEVRATVRRLRAGQHGWSALAVSERIRWVERFRDWVYANEDRINGILGAETGKPRAELGIELNSSMSVLHYYCRHAEQFLRDDTPRPSSLMTVLKTLRTRHVAYPIVGVISPWNFPLAMFLWDSIPALLAGAAVVVKPSEHTPLAATAVIQGWSEIGAPDVFACVNGTGETGAAVAEAADFVQFTGSTRTGTTIAVQAAAALKPYSLELGGNDPAIVLPDADVDQAAQGIVFNGLLNSGQMCVAVERVYAVGEVHDQLVSNVVRRVQALRRDPDAEDSDITGLITPEQIDICSRHVDDALAKGATALIGGHRLGDNGFAPTVLVDVDHTMAVMTDETFGPVLPIMRVDDADEAVRLANDSPYGLSASVWSADRRTATGIAERLEAGTVNINDAATHILCHPIPQSGWKSSGVGARLGGRSGMLKFTRTQAITANRVELSVVGTLAGFPYSQGKSRILDAVGRLGDGSGLRHRLSLGGPRAGHAVIVERTIAAPPEVVFDWLADGTNYAAPFPGATVDYTRHGDRDRFGSGAVRRLRGAGTYIEEEITGYEQPHRIEYRITGSRPPLGGHRRACIELTPTPAGTRVAWTSTFDDGIATAYTIMPALRIVFGRILAQCAKECTANTDEAGAGGVRAG